MKRLLTALFFAFTAAAPAAAQTVFGGPWEGSIVLPSVSIGIRVTISQTPDFLGATIDIPIQHAKDLPLSNITATEALVHFELPAGPGLAVFDGRVSHDSITGTFTQGSALGVFWLHKVPAVLPASTLSLPYREEEVRIQNGSITLAGTLSLPPGKKPTPAVILLTGSGPQNRNEEILGFQPFSILADHLARNGFAVLRCDDRGVGGSTGTMSTSTTADFASDASAMASYLQSRKEINGSRVGMLGHSEGADVAAICAAARKDIAFLILLAEPALPGDSTILSQISILGHLQGQSDAAITRALDLEHHVFTAVREHRGWEALEDTLTAEVKLHGQGRTTQGMPSDSLVRAQVKTQLDGARTAWFAYFIAHDPAKDLARVHCPVLALFGELDTQVPPSQHKDPLLGALMKAGNRKVETITIPRANHLFQEAVTGSPGEYGQMKKEFAPGVLDGIIRWMKEQN